MFRARVLAVGRCCSDGADGESSIFALLLRPHAPTSSNFSLSYAVCCFQGSDAQSGRRCPVHTCRKRELAESVVVLDLTSGCCSTPLSDIAGAGYVQTTNDDERTENLMRVSASLLCVSQSIHHRCPRVCLRAFKYVSHAANRRAVCV